MLLLGWRLMLGDATPIAVNFTTTNGIAAGVSFKICNDRKGSLSTIKASGFQVSRLHSASVHKLKTV